MGKRALDSDEDWSRWYIVNETQRGKVTTVIKRCTKIDGKTVWQRYPRLQYKDMTDSDIEAFVTRLNGEYEAALKRAKEAYEIKHKFITQELIDQWETHIRANQNSQHMALQINTMVKVKFLHFFVHKMELPDPVDWYTKQDIWGKALMNEKPEGMSDSKWQKIRLHEEGAFWSGKTIKNAVMYANRFIKYIHKNNPRLFPLLVFDPIPSAVLSRHDAKRNLDGKRDGRGKFVKDEHWQTIIKKTDPNILPFIKLAYYLGFRDAETLGVKITDVKKNYFHAQRQLVTLPEPNRPNFGPLKNNKDRKVFYWFITNKEVYELIQKLPDLMHPNTLSRMISQEMVRLGLNYKMHDFRRTFITKALKAGHPQIDVRDCAGHADLQTTNLYAIRDEFFDDENWTPDET